MDFRFTEEEEAFRKEVSQWLEKEVPQRWLELDEWPTVESDEGLAIFRNFIRKLGEKRWLAPAYPKKYGGAEMGPMERFILGQELAAHQAPVGVEVDSGANWVGPTVLLFGTEEQKNKYLPGIAKGEKIYAIAYSEPNAGSDLGSLQTRATEVNDGYVLNGQKVWTSYAHHSDYLWLAARTDPDAPKHRGISLFIVDINTPGIVIRPMANLLNTHIHTEVFLDDALIPKDSLIGEKNKGWYQLMAALEYERSPISGGTMTHGIISKLVQYAKQTKHNGDVIANDPLIRQELAQAAIENEIMRLMSYRLASMISKGQSTGVEASIAKIISTEQQRHLTNLGMRIARHYGLLEKESKWALFQGLIARQYLFTAVSGIAAGSEEIDRNIIAQRGLGLPR